MTVAYNRIDFQLLFELRLALEERRPLPVPLLRVLEARGWVSLPVVDARFSVEAFVNGQPFPTASYELGAIDLTPLGVRELSLFRKQIDYEEMLALLAEDEETLDESDDSSEDGE